MMAEQSRREVKSDRIIWTLKGRLHRVDGPAVIKNNGSQYWYYNGQRHRGDDLPAVIKSDGTRKYYQYDKLHRDGDRPAFISGDGKIRHWFVRGQCHRDGDKAAMKSPGLRLWMQHDQCHREGDKPALVSDQMEQWFCRGNHHRDGGKPAIIDDGGLRMYYEHGICIKCESSTVSAMTGYAAKLAAKRLKTASSVDVEEELTVSLTKAKVSTIADVD